MRPEEFNFINEIFQIIDTKIANTKLQTYLRDHLREMLNNYTTMNDLTTGIEFFKENNDGTIDKYFKLIFHPKNNDFNIQKFDKISTIYSNDKTMEKKEISFAGNLIEIDEIENVNQMSYSKNSFVTTQNTTKKKYLKNKLVYNYRLLSKISSTFFIPSYNLEEETFIKDDNSTTKSSIVVSKYCDEKIVIEDIKKTDTFLAKYIDNWGEIKNQIFMSSNYLVEEKFNDKDKPNLIPSNIVVSKISKDTYQQVERKLRKV